jgi:hypothetical protein
MECIVRLKFVYSTVIFVGFHYIYENKMGFVIISAILPIGRGDPTMQAWGRGR